jgi:hypothetical protein
MIVGATERFRLAVRVDFWLGRSGLGGWGWEFCAPLVAGLQTVDYRLVRVGCVGVVLSAFGLLGAGRCGCVTLKATLFHM